MPQFASSWALPTVLVGLMASFSWSPVAAQGVQDLGTILSKNANLSTYYTLIQVGCHSNQFSSHGKPHVN